MRDPQLILALDQGTTSSRALLFDRSGNVVATAQREFEQIFPRPGWVEHDPEEIWRAQISTAEEALEQAGVGGEDVAGVGITNQRETTVLWDRATGEPLHRAIVWQDRRTAEAIAELGRHGHDRAIRERCGLIPDAYFSAGKIAWLLDNVPDARRRAEDGEIAFGTIDTWLAYRLTDNNAHVTDPSNASRTMLYDIHRGSWDDELLAIFNVPRQVLPEVVPSSGTIGDVAIESPLRGLPVAGLIGDQQAALAGQSCSRSGMAKNTYGTGCFMLLNTGSIPVPSQHRLLTTVAWDTGEGSDFALEGSVFVGGAVVQWLRDGLGIIRSAAEVEQLAASVADNGGVVLVPAFAGLGAPHWDPHARGSLFGLTRGSTAAHIARAALESIALQVADLADAMAADSDAGVDELRVDGGAARNDFLMQLQADILQIPVERPAVTESTALGAALMAGLALGFWSDVDDLSACRAVDRRFEPGRGTTEVTALRARWSEAIDRAGGWEDLSRRT